MNTKTIFFRGITYLFLLTMLTALICQVSAEEITMPSITSNRDTIIAKDQIVTSITGDPNTMYWVFLSNEDLTEDKYPKIVFDSSKISQDDPTHFESAVNNLAPIDPTTGQLIPGTWCEVVTNNDRTQQIKWTTNTATEGNIFSFQVVSLNDTSKSDMIKIKVSQSTLSITVSCGSGSSHYDFAPITFSGINTDSDSTYLFITGPDLPNNGAGLDSLSTPCITGNEETFTKTAVHSDSTWEYCFYTEGRDLAIGTYEIYGVSEPKSKNDLSDAKYGKESFYIKAPKIDITAIPERIEQGEELNIGWYGEIPIKFWIIGDDYFSIEYIGGSGAWTPYTYTIPDSVTCTMEPGIYYALAQIPLNNQQFDVYDVDYIEGDSEVTVYNQIDQTSFIMGKGNLMGIQALNALKKELNLPGVDDTYSYDSFEITQITVPTASATQTSSTPIITTTPTPIDTATPTPIDTATPTPIDTYNDADEISQLNEEKITKKETIIELIINWFNSIFG